MRDVTPAAAARLRHAIKTTLTKVPRTEKSMMVRRGRRAFGRDDDFHLIPTIAAPALAPLHSDAFNRRAA